METYQSGVPLTPLTIDGRIRHLRLTLKEMRLIEERLSQLKGQDVLILEIFSPGRRWSMTELVVMLTAMLRHEDLDLSEDYVAEHIHMGNLAEVTTAIGNCLNPAMPEPTAVTNGSAPDPQSNASPGSTSGRSDDTTSASVLTISGPSPLEN